MPTNITAGDASAGAVITSGNDGIVKIQTGAAGAKVDAVTLDTSGNMTVLGSVVGAASVINNTSAPSDITLLIGQTAYVDVSAATSALLRIATGDNQLYEVSITGVGNTGSVLANFAFLQPNGGTSYTNFFRYEYTQGSGATVGQQSGWVSGMPVSAMDTRQSYARVSTKTNAKSSVFSGIAYDGTSPRSFSGAAVWQASASSTTTSDTTTAWTSLGTLTFPVTTTARVYIKRVA